MSTNDGIIIKTFGTTEEQVAELIKEYLRFKTIEISLIPEVLEVTIKIIYSERATKTHLDFVTSGIYSKLKDYIYADYETTLPKRIVDIMRQRDKKLAVAESVTGGLITSMLVECGGASHVLYEGITAYSNDAKINRLKVHPDTLAEHGAVSPETASEMAAGLLETGRPDLVVATTGYAEADNAKQNGLVYIAVGDRTEIHVYSHKFFGGRNIVREAAAKTALYYILKYFAV